MHIRELGGDPGEAALDEVGIAGGGDMVLADQVRQQRRDTAVGLAVKLRQVVDGGIDVDAGGACPGVEPVRHQQSFGCGGIAGALDGGRLRDPARNDAQAVAAAGAEELLPMGALQPQRVGRQRADPKAPGSGATDASRGSASICAASGRA